MLPGAQSLACEPKPLEAPKGESRFSVAARGEKSFRRALLASSRANPQGGDLTGWAGLLVGLLP